LRLSPTRSSRGSRSTRTTQRPRLRRARNDRDERRLRRRPRPPRTVCPQISPGASTRPGTRPLGPKASPADLGSDAVRTGPPAAETTIRRMHDLLRVPQDEAPKTEGTMDTERKPRNSPGSRTPRPRRTTDAATGHPGLVGALAVSLLLGALILPPAPATAAQDHLVPVIVRGQTGSLDVAERLVLQ